MRRIIPKIYKTYSGYIIKVLEIYMQEKKMLLEHYGAGSHIFCLWPVVLTKKAY